MSADTTFNSDISPLYLSDNPIRFESLSATTVSIFFDDSNRQVFTVRSNGVAGVLAKGPDSKINFSFRLEDRGEITSMRFCSDMKVLAVQRSPRSVDFINFIAGCDTTEYSQTCKGKGTKIVGFCWTSLYEIVYVTDHGIEQYQVIMEKKMLKLLKTVSLPINWFVWSLESGVLLASSGSIGNTIHPFSFKQGAVTRYPKFDMEIPAVAQAGQRCVDQRDVTIALIYDQLYAIQLPPQQMLSPRSATGCDAVLYNIRDAGVFQSDVLKLNVTGRLSVSVVDNVVVVHHPASKTSLMFDIQLPCDVRESVNFHQPFAAPQRVIPYKLILPAVPAQVGVEAQQLNCELYSQTCVVFFPDVVLDAKIGCFWYLRLNLEPLLTIMTDKCRLMDFLLMRRDSKSSILALCSDILSQQQQQSSLVIVSSIFNKLNRVYHNHMESQQGTWKPSINERCSRQGEVSSLIKFCPVIDQSDMYTFVFSKFDQTKRSIYLLAFLGGHPTKYKPPSTVKQFVSITPLLGSLVPLVYDTPVVSFKFIVGVLIEYIRSLSFYQIPAQHYLYELIITMLVEHSCFYQLHQFLQYHVLSDSKPLAFSLLSLDSAYPPAYQLALDMLKRLQTANESIIEVLLSKKQLLTALRFVQSVGLSDQISARKFLEAARSADCPMTYYSVYRFIEQRNVRQRGNAKFVAADHCDQYVKYFETLFPETVSPS